MNDEELKRAIHQIAEHDIGDTMNRWNEIYAQLDLPKSRPVQRWSRAAAILAFLLIGLTVTGLSVYAFSRLFWMDDGLQAINDAGLVEPLSQSQTIDGITVTLERGYADGNRIALWLTVENLPPFDGQVMDNIFDVYLSYGDDPFERPGKVIYRINHHPEGDLQHYELIFTHQEPRPTDGVFNLRLNMFPNERGFYVVPWWAHIFRLDQENYKTTLTLSDTFKFDFALPVPPVITIEPMLEIESLGFPMILERLEIAPSATKAFLCYDLKNKMSPMDWIAHLSIRFDDGARIAHNNLIGKRVKRHETRQCIEVEFPAPYITSAEFVEIDVWFEAMVVGSDAVIPPDAAEKLAAQGIDVEFIDTGDNYTIRIHRYPQDMDNSTLDRRIAEALQMAHDGEWIFRVALPE